MTMMDPPLKAILILGTMADPHVERVVHMLSTSGEVPFIIIDYLRDAHCSLKLDSAGNLTLRVNREEIILAESIIWDCVKLIAGTPFYLGGDEKCSGYAANEWRAFFKLLCALGGSRTVNSLSSRLCMVKPYQQRIAAAVGFSVPPTIVTNDKSDACHYVTESSFGTIIKSLSSCKIRPPSEGEPVYYNIMTMRVDEQDISESTQNEIGYCPIFLQTEIVKDYELRIVFIDGVCCPYAINSQAYKSSEVDWRQGYEVVDFKPCAIDGEFKERICSFMSQMGLFSGSLDFVVGRDGQRWFLECNQQGAWAWLDDISDGLIARTFAKGLTRRFMQSM